jgi:hypothetical protein
VITTLRRLSPIAWTVITVIILALLPLGPVRAVARYLLIGYLPGLAIWRQLRSSTSSIVDLVLYPSLLSILPFSWIALAGVVLGLDLRIAGIIAVAIFLAIGFTRGWSSPIKEANGDRLALGLSLLLVVLLLVIAFAANSFQAVAWDASLHAAIVSRILADVVPPDSPMMAGQPANYYWLYHFYCAALMRLTGFSVYQVFAILNVHAFVLFILAGYRIAGRLTTNLFGRLSVVWMLVFGLNAFGWIIFFTSGSTNPDKWYSLVAPFAMVKDYSPSLGSLIHEFLDGAPFAITFAFDIAWLDILLGRAEGERGGALVTGALILATLFYVHPLTAVFLIGASFAALIVFLIINRSRSDEFVGLFVDLAIITFATALITAPYAWNILHGKTGAPLSVALNLAYLKNQAYTMLATVGLVGIIVVPAIWLGVRERQRAVMILTFFTVTILLAAFVIHVELEAEYKLVYLLAFGLAPLAAVAWNFWNRTLITRVIFILALVICVPTNMLTSYCFTVQPPRENRDPTRFRLLDWVREKTPANAILIEYPWWTKYQTSEAAYFYLDRFWFDIGVYGNRRQLVGYTTPMLEQWGYRDIGLRQELARKLISGEILAPADLSYLAALHAPIIVITNLSVVGLKEFDPASYLRIYEDGDLRAYRVLLPES